MKDILRPATEADAVSLCGRLRLSDVREIYIASGLSPLEALLEGVRASVPHAWVLCSAVSGQPVLMGGVRPCADGIGLVWLLASPLIEQHALSVQRECKRMLLRIWESGEYRALANIVPAENSKVINWLIRLGALVMHTGHPAGIGGELFDSFVFAPEGGLCALQ